MVDLSLSGLWDTSTTDEVVKNASFLKFTHKIYLTHLKSYSQHV